MSWDNFAAHLYGVEIDGRDVRAELLKDYDGDHIEFFYAIMYDDYPEGFPEEGKSVEIVGGPDNIWYVGYGAVMPYSNFRITKEEADANIEAVLKYLLGTRYDPKEYKPDDIFDIWSE